MDKGNAPKSMQALGSLLERYKSRFTPPQASVEKECLVVIKELTNITLDAHQVSYTVSTRTLVISASSLIKTELRFRHAEILAELQKRLNERSAPVSIL